MIQIELTGEKMKEWFPETYKSFLEDYYSSNRQVVKKKFTPKAEEDIEWMVSYSVNIPKAKTDEEAIQNQINYENKLRLPYEERCKSDLSKLKVDCHMYAGYYGRTDRSFDKEIPKYIIDLFYEVTKITMLQEQIFVNDPVVLDSLKDFQHLLQQLMEDMGIELEGTEQFEQKYKDVPLDMDEILDKISANGVESLTAKELKFLDKMSRG